jgi:multiple antibiotic resistance protein
VTVFSAATLLFLVMDPFGNIPIFLSILEPYDARRRLVIIARELLIALAVLLLFLFAGQYILDALKISESSLTAAGGVILFLIALRMIFPRVGGVMEHGGDDDGEPLVVPLAIPLIAGPSAMASVMFIMSSDPSRAGVWAGAVFLAWLLSGTVLMLAVRFSRLLGRRGLTAIQRLMGMILTAIAINMMLSGIREFFAL